VLYDGHWSNAELQDLPQGQRVPVVYRDGRAVVRLDLPASGMIILA
jgi:hypothetical protein